ncbi:MAG: hypothetical protein PHW53_01195 [Patescibacteria group bacterium]|nr:hypothetical protein [Patescibacteria group bacterium]
MQISKNDVQYNILNEEFLLAQRQMDKYDQLSTTIKTWAVTLWVAASGWVFQTETKQVALLGALLVLIFWFFDSYNKVYRTNYKKRRDEIQNGLQILFFGRPLPTDFLSPNLPIHDEKNVVRSMFLLHVGLPYAILIIISLLIYANFN